MVQSPFVSIVICTYNRAASLQITLSSLLHSLQGTRAHIEVLVINNACTDDTDAVVARCAREATFPVCVIHEPQPGLAHARNASLRSAKGDIICSIDDDVIVPDRWLEHLLTGFALGENIGCVGGRILLKFPTDRPPAWVDHRVRESLSEFDKGDQSHVLPVGAGVIGANYAFTREAMRAVGEFNTILGRKKDQLLGGEESEYVERIWRAGFSVAYSAEGYLYHVVPPERLNYQTLCARFRGHGMSMALQRPTGPFTPLKHLPNFILSLLGTGASLLTGSPRLVYPNMFRLMKRVGWYEGWYRKSFGRTAEENIRL